MMTALEPDRIVWRTSSYGNGSATCVEVGWRTSSYSTGNGACVQVAPAPDRVLVRDSKDSDGLALTISTPAWRTFLTTLTHGLGLPSRAEDFTSKTCRVRSA